MSHLLHKVKDAVSGDKHTANTSSNAGTHNSNLANKADPRFDSDRDHRAAPGGVTGGGYGSGTGAGTGAGTGSGTYGTGSTNYGAHDSNLANKADPRFDSDRDHRAAPGGVTGGGYGTGAGTGSGNYSTGSGIYGTGSTNYGSHDSNLANKADPRFDSDRDHRAAPGGVTGGGYGTGSDTYSTGTGTYGTGSTNYGPHDSNLANKADPRFDSDRDHRAAPGGVTGGGYGSGTGTGTYGTGSDTYSTDSGTYGSGSTNHGPHGSNLANKADPRFDSDRDNRARHQDLSGGSLGSSSYNTPGSGHAQRTAGPHDSDIANKLDPRVDSDLDNSRTVGGNVTRY